MAGYGSVRRPVLLAGGAAAGCGFLAPTASAPVGGSGRCSLPASSRPEGREGWEGREDGKIVGSMGESMREISARERGVSGSGE